MTDLPAVANPAITDARWRRLLLTGAARPDAVREAYAGRSRPDRLLSSSGTLFLVAADHPARGALASGPDLMAMADRRLLLERLVVALSPPAGDGVLGSPDLLYPPDGDVWSAVDAAVRLLNQISSPDQITVEEGAA